MQKNNKMILVLITAFLIPASVLLALIGCRHGEADIIGTSGSFITNPNSKMASSDIPESHFDDLSNDSSSAMSETAGSSLFTSSSGIDTSDTKSLFSSTSGSSSTGFPTGSSSASISANPDLSDKLLVNGKKIAGGVVCDYISTKYWGSGADSWLEGDLFGMLQAGGMNYVRVGVTTNSCPELDQTDAENWHNLDFTEKTWSSREYAAQILREAQAKGMKKDLFLFLSDTAAHGGQQFAPDDWKNLTVALTAARLERYCYITTKYYMDKGIDIDIYEIGNEIERGILEFRPGERIILPAGIDQMTNVKWMTDNVWNIEAELLKKAIAGVKRANPEAVIGLHIAGVGWTTGELLTTGFFNAMTKYEVPYDIACLSYYSDYPKFSKPAAPYFKSELFNNLIAFLGKTKGKKVLISEWAYPNSAAAVWSQPNAGYPFTEEGQRKWTRDFMDYCNHNPYILGSIYFYPEYFKGIALDSVLTSSGLFKDPFTPMAALAEFGK